MEQKGYGKGWATKGSGKGGMDAGLQALEDDGLGNFDPMKEAAIGPARAY